MAQAVAFAVVGEGALALPLFGPLEVPSYISIAPSISPTPHLIFLIIKNPIRIRLQIPNSSRRLSPSFPRSRRAKKNPRGAIRRRPHRRIHSPPDTPETISRNRRRDRHRSRKNRQRSWRNRRRPRCPLGNKNFRRRSKNPRRSRGRSSSLHVLLS